MGKETSRIRLRNRKTSDSIPLAVQPPPEGPPTGWDLSDSMNQLHRQHFKNYSDGNELLQFLETPMLRRKKIELRGGYAIRNLPKVAADMREKLGREHLVAADYYRFPLRGGFLEVERIGEHRMEWRLFDPQNIQTVKITARDTRENGLTIQIGNPRDFNLVRILIATAVLHPVDAVMELG